MTSSQLGGIAANWNCSNPNDEVLTTTCPRLRSRKNARLRPLETATAEMNGFIVNRHGRLSLPDVDPVHDLRQVETSRCVPKSAVRNTLIADNCDCEKTDYELTFRLPVDPRGGEADVRFELSDDRRPVRSFCEWNWSNHSGVAVVHGGTPRMRSPLSGPIATLFMFVPLVAIPLLAVFGMPQFSTLSPPAQVEELKFASDKEKPAPKVLQPEGELAGGVQVTDSGAASQPATGTSSRPVNDTDPFAEFARAPEGDAAQPQQQESRPAKSLADDRAVAQGKRPQRWPTGETSTSTPKDSATAGEPGFDEGKTTRTDRDRALAEASIPTPTEQKRSKAGTRMTADFDANDQSAERDRGVSNVVNNLSDEAKSWKAAIARLNALGIRDYQLQPGQREGEFLFSCHFVSRHNPRVMQRFEAEAGEPLQAVQRVLQQIDEWKGRRSEARDRNSSREAASKVTALSSQDEAASLSAVDVSNR
jgi:hypothetical protein